MCRVSDSQGSTGLRPGCAMLLVFAGDCRGSITLVLVLLQVREAQAAGIVSLHCATADPAGQMPGKLRQTPAGMTFVVN